MITAVALPAIVTDLADWTRLREASWIINGYLLVYVVTMPVAGRLADLYGARRLFLWALVIFTLGSLLAGAAPTLELLIVARLVQAVGGGALVPVATSAASHLFSGAVAPARPGRRSARSRSWAWPRVRSWAPRSSAPSTPRLRVSRLGLDAGSLPRAAARRPPGAGCSTSTSRWGSSRSWSRGRRAAAGRRRAAQGRVDLAGAAAVLRVPRRGAGRAHAPRLAGGRGRRRASTRPRSRSCSWRSAVVAGPLTIVRGLRVRDPFLDPRLFRSASFSSAPRSSRCSRGTASRRRSWARPCSSTACCTAARTSSGSRSARSRARRRSGRSCRASRSGCCRCRSCR